MKLILMLLVTSALSAQTTIPTDALRPGTIIGVMVCLPPGTGDGKCKVAALDPSITLDMSTNPPTLKASQLAVTAALKFGKTVYNVTAAQSSFPVGSAAFIEGSLDVYRSGILMAVGQDYTMSGTPAAPAVLFLPAQVPQRGDVVSIKYVWK